MNPASVLNLYKIDFAVCPRSHGTSTDYDHLRVGLLLEAALGESGDSDQWAKAATVGIHLCPNGAAFKEISNGYSPRDEHMRCGPLPSSARDIYGSQPDRSTVEILLPQNI